METQGTQLMNQINSGEMKFKQSDVATQVKQEVSEALSEIINIGARVRPLLLNDKRVGWIRALNYSERKLLDRVVNDSDEQIVAILSHCTTLTEEEVLDLDIHELNSILTRLHHMTLADLSLYPYMSAFVTTQSSQTLWAGRFDGMFNCRQIDMFDGRVLHLIDKPDLVTLWAALSRIREESIAKLEQTLNFGTLIKAWAGKSADKYVNDLIRSLQTYQPDSIQPWIDVIDYVQLQAKDESKHFTDGFGHSHEDNTVQGLLREMHGMLEGDKHEQLMNSFYGGQIAAARVKEEETQQIIAQRRAELEQLEDNGSMIVVTDAEVRKREHDIKTNSIETQLQKRMKEELEGQPESEEINVGERISKYFQPGQ